jgi:hypothetical protein
VTTFRIIGDPVASDECFIPVTDTPRARAILKALLDPSPEDLERRRVQAEEYEARFRAKLATHLARHVSLVAEHTGQPIVHALLLAHAPSASAGLVECHACPSYYVTEYDVTDLPEWPCPTWTLISEATR